MQSANSSLDLPPSCSATGGAMMLRPLISALDGAGIDTHSLLYRQGLRAEMLRDPLRRVDHRAIQAIWREAPSLSGNEEIGIVAARLYRPGTFHVLDYLAATAPDLRAAFLRAVKYLRLLDDLLRLELDEEGERVVVTISTGAALGMPFAQAEFLMATLAVMARRITGVNEDPLEVHFLHERPRAGGLARDHFGSPIRYRSDAIRIVSSRSHLELPCVGADPVLSEVVGAHANALLYSLPSGAPYLLRVREIMAAHIEEGPSLDLTAKQLGTSPRTLRRRLAEWGTTHRALLDGLRREMSEKLLEDHHLGIDEVAAQLGFANASTFHRAYKRWTGETPSRARPASRRPRH